MPIDCVASLDDPRLAAYRQLTRPRIERADGRFIVEGRLLVERLAASRYEIESILVDGDRLDSLPSELDEATQVFTTPPGLVDELIGFAFHRGVLAAGRRQPSLDIASAVTSREGPLLMAACVRIADPVNLGGIMRNCVAFGVNVVVVDKDCADAFSRRVLRVSMGAPFSLEVVESISLLDDLARLKQLRVERCAAVVSDQAERLEDADRLPRMCLLFGNEGDGLPSAVRQRCDREWTIPMRLGTDSLNAAVASGVFLYHFTCLRA